MLQLNEPLTEINIAVLGNESVGKSTLVQRALDLPGLPPSQATQRNIKAEGQEYLLRLLEVSNDDADVDDEDDTVMWPETIDGKIMPKIDGALVLYSIKDKSSLEDIPEMLSECHPCALPKMQSLSSVVSSEGAVLTLFLPYRCNQQGQHPADSHRHQM